jgi:hypothetical protein
MRYSVENYAETGDFGIVNVVNEPLSAQAMIDKRVVRAYVADQDTASDVVLTVEIQNAAGVQTARQLDLVTLVGLTGITSVTIEAFAAAASLGSQVITVSQPVQQNYAVAAFDVVADEVTITFNVGSGEEFSIGYLFAGTLSADLGIFDASLNYSIESANPRNITRAGTSITSDTYLTAGVDLTTKKHPFSTLRDHVKLWAQDGYATPRLWYFDETCILTGEVVYGILDSNTVQLDPEYVSGEAIAQTTIGIRETQ